MFNYSYYKTSQSSVESYWITLIAEHYIIVKSHQNTEELYWITLITEHYRTAKSYTELLLLQNTTEQQRDIQN